MGKIVVFTCVFLLSVYRVAEGQQPAAPTSAPPNQWTVSVVHTVDFQKHIEWMKQQQGTDRILAVPASPPPFFLNFATGMVIDDQGHVVTRLANLSPFDKQPTISVTSADGSVHPATLIGIDGATGFAVLEVDSLKGRTPKVLPADSIRPGEPVRILSTDFRQQIQATADGLRAVYFPSITTAPGSIGQSSIYARARGAVTLYSAGMQARNDSSVVISADDQILGISQYAGFGRAYLFPVALVRDTIARRVIERKGFVAPGWLGARGDSVAELAEPELRNLGLPKPAGVVVREVAANSPAALSGLLPGDVITGIDEFDIAGATDLIKLLTSSPEGRKVTIRAVRDHREIEFNALLGARSEQEWRGPLPDVFDQYLEPVAAQVEELRKRRQELVQQYSFYRDKAAHAQAPQAVADANETLRDLEFEIRQLNEAARALGPAGAAVFSTPPVRPAVPDAAFVDKPESAPLGFLARNLEPQLAEFYHVKGGVLVMWVSSMSPVGRAGLRANDVIVGTPTKELTGEELSALLMAAKGPVRLKIVRNARFLILRVNRK